MIAFVKVNVRPLHGGSKGHGTILQLGGEMDCLSVENMNQMEPGNY